MNGQFPYPTTPYNLEKFGEWRTQAAAHIRFWHNQCCVENDRHEFIQLVQKTLTDFDGYAHQFLPLLEAKRFRFLETDDTVRSVNEWLHLCLDRLEVGEPGSRESVATGRRKDEFDTTPTYARPDTARVNAAKAAIPGIANNAAPEQYFHPADAGDPPVPPNKFISAGSLVSLIKCDGHAPDAASWALHEMIDEGCFTNHGAWKSGPPMVIGANYTHLPTGPAGRYKPSDFNGPAPFNKLVLRTTDTLWERLRTTPRANPETNGTLEELIRDLAGSVSAMETNRRRAEKMHPIEAIGFLSSAEALNALDRSRYPGIDRIELLCDEIGNGSGLTAANVRALRARLCRGRSMSKGQADALNLAQAATLFEALVGDVTPLPVNESKSASDIERIRNTPQPAADTRSASDLLSALNAGECATGELLEGVGQLRKIVTAWMELPEGDLHKPRPCDLADWFREMEERVEAARPALDVARDPVISARDGRQCKIGKFACEASALNLLRALMQHVFDFLRSREQALKSDSPVLWEQLESILQRYILQGDLDKLRIEVESEFAAARERRRRDEPAGQGSRTIAHSPVETPVEDANDTRKGKRINEQMLGMLQKKPESLSWSASQWADALNCSKSTIVGTPTWKETIKTARAREKADKELRQQRNERCSEDD